MRIALCGATGTVGRHVRSAAETRGHDVVALSRRTGHDLTRDSLVDALSGVQTVIDVSGVQTLSRRRATTFFESVSRTIQASGAAAGVSHLVTLSIVGIDGVNSSYYGAKLAQERAVKAGRLPWTLVRSTQFHEFAAQTILRGAVGPLVMVPHARLRPVAAAEVAEHLVDAAEHGPAGVAGDLIGPQDEVLVDMVRKVLAHDGARRLVVPFALPGEMGAAMASGRLRGDPATARRTAVRFGEWLADRGGSAARGGQNSP